MSRSVPLVVAVIVLAVSLSTAQHWEIEQVDTAPWGTVLQMRASPSGDIYLAYANRYGAMRIAHKDSVWRHEDVDTTLARVVDGRCSFDAGPHDRLGLAWVDLVAFSMRLAERDSSGWTASTIPFETTWYPTVAFAYDTTGSPAVVFNRDYGIDFAIRSETSWVAETILVGNPGPPLHDFNVFWLDIGPANEPHAFCGQEDYLPGGQPGSAEPYLYTRIYTRYRSGQTWHFGTGASGLYAGMSAYCVTSDRSGQEHACFTFNEYGEPSRFYYNGEIVVNNGVRDGAVHADSLGSPYLVYVQPDSSVVFAYRRDTWWFIGIPEVHDATSCELLVDDFGQPVIALHRPGSGVWLVRGVGIVGAEERPGPQVPGLGLAATIVRGALVLGAVGSRQNTAYRAELLDISGRKVLDLKPGENDVSRLAPSVYFIREHSAFGSQHSAASSVERDASTVRKVVIQR